MPQKVEGLIVKEALGDGDPLTRLEAVWPSQPEWQCRLLIAVARKGLLDEASARMTEEALNTCRPMWAAVLVDARRFEESLEVLGDLRGCVADIQAGRAQLALNEPLIARRRIEAAMKSCGGQSLTMRHLLGISAIRSGDVAGGLRILERAVTDHPNATWARRSLLAELEAAGRFEAAAAQRELLKK